MPKKKFHALTKEQRIEMYNSGFTPHEIAEFDYSLDVKYNSTFWQNMMRSRRKYCVALKVNGWSGREIMWKINRWYRNREMSTPWEFFRMEYARATQRPVLSRGKFREFYELREDISRHFGRAYGRVQAVQPKHLIGMRGLPRRPKRKQ